MSPFIEQYFDITRKDSENPIKDSLYGNSGIYVKTKDEKLKNKEKDVVSFTSSLENADDKISMKQKKLFEKIIPENLSDTQEGLLYYRVRYDQYFFAFLTVITIFFIKIISTDFLYSLKEILWLFLFIFSFYFFILFF